MVLILEKKRKIQIKDVAGEGVGMAVCYSGEGGEKDMDVEMDS